MHRIRIRLVQSLMGQDAWSRVRQPERIRHLVLTSSLADMGMWSAPTEELSKACLIDVQKGLAVNVAESNQSTSPYAGISVAVTCV